MTELLPPDHPQAPKYWMLETGGKLVPAMKRYLSDEKSEPGDVDLIRAYLVQWIYSSVWDDAPMMDDAGRAELKELRLGAHKLTNRRQIEHWIEVATDWGMDPL